MLCLETKRLTGTKNVLSEIADWAAANGELIGLLTAVSLLMFVGTLVLIPVLVARIPEDYFTGEHRHRARTRNLHPLLYWGGLVVKNLLGLVLVLAGIAMLLLPGQGILSILIGISLMNFPGKYALERKLVSLPKVMDGINWLRKKSGRPPLQEPKAP